MAGVVGVGTVLAGRKPRVLVVGHTYVVGLNQGKLDEIGRRGNVQVGLVVPSSWRSPELRILWRLEFASDRLAYYPLKTVLKGRCGGYVFTPGSLLAALRQFRPDLVHVEQEAFSLVAFECAALCSRLGIPFSLFCWENVEHPLGLARRWTRAYVARRAALAVAGNRGAASLLQKWGYRGPSIVAPQLGVDTVRFSPQLRTPTDGHFRVGFVGRLVPGKGVDLLIRACKMLRAEGHSVRLIIVGRGPSEHALRRMAADGGLPPLWVEWRGWVAHSSVPRQLGSMDVLVLPSRSLPDWTEQFGHVLIEAMAMGIPVIGSCSGAIPDVIGRPDLLFPENDVSTLVALLRRMLTDSQWRREIERYGLNRARQEFSNAAVGQTTEKLWITTLAGRLQQPEARRTALFRAN